MSVEHRSTKGVPTDLGVSGYWITRSGAPLLLVGDTVWPLAVRCTDEQIQAYLDNARELGFNVIGLFSTTPWAAWDEHSTNLFGEKPYVNNNPWELNAPYWERYRRVIDEAGRRGIYVYLCVGHPLRAKVPSNPLDTARKAYDYGHALGSFLADSNQNIIWTPGTDQNPEQVDLGRVDELAKGIADGVNGTYDLDGPTDYSTTFMSYHCCGGKTTVDYFHEKPWLDFNGFQTWKNYESAVSMARRQYERNPAKPGICHEPAYEGDRSHRKAKDEEEKTGWHCRLQAYWSLFSGACGFINGTTGIWDLGTREWTSYEDGLRSEGRTDMQWVRRLMESKPLGTLVPDQSLITSDAGAPTREKDYICAARGRDDSYAFVYSTRGRGFTLALARLSGGRVRARWFDPRTGEYREPAEAPAVGAMGFDPPGGERDGNDWVLVAEAGR